MGLDRRTGYRAVGAENAAITRFWFEERAAALALVKPLAGIRRHGLVLRMPAMRTGNRAIKNRRPAFGVQAISLGLDPRAAGRVEPGELVLKAAYHDHHPFHGATPI